LPLFIYLGCECEIVCAFYESQERVPLSLVSSCELLTVTIFF